MTTQTAAFAAAIRAQAPGRTTRENHFERPSNLDSARAVRDAAPGRATR